MDVGLIEYHHQPLIRSKAARRVDSTGRFGGPDVQRGVVDMLGVVP